MGEESDGEVLSRRERRKREVRQRIMEAAMARFVAQGFDATTVDQIAEDADVAQKTFFNYFPTKQDLFRQLAEDRIDELQEILEEERGGGGSTPDKLAHGFVRLSELIEQRGALGRDLVAEVMRARSVGDTGEDVSRLHQSFGEILRDGQQAGDVRRDHPVQFLTEMVVGCFGAVMTNWLHTPDYPVKDRLAATAAFLGEAISPPVGRGGRA
jgi:AcrR family transcriptional regulator